MDRSVTVSIQCSRCKDSLFLISGRNYTNICRGCGESYSATVSISRAFQDFGTHVTSFGYDGVGNYTPMCSCSWVGQVVTGLSEYERTRHIDDVLKRHRDSVGG